jgi:glycosyltransferase 2 family protein
MLLIMNRSSTREVDRSGSPPMKPNPRSWRAISFRVLKWAVTLGLILFVVYQAGLFEDQGRRELMETLKGVDLFYLGLSFLISVLMNLVSSYKWHVLTLSKKLTVGLSRLFALYYVGKFFNLFLPTGMGGDIARVYQLGKITGTNSESLASVFMERFTGMITLTAVSLIAVLVSLRHYDIPIITVSLALCVFITGFVIYLVLDRRPLVMLSRLLSNRISAMTTILGKLNRIHDAIRAYKDDIPTLVHAFVGFPCVLLSWRC